MSKLSKRNSNNTVLSESRRLKDISEFEAAAAYGTPALSDASSDEQIARAIFDSKRPARPTQGSGWASPATRVRGGGLQGMSEYEAAAAYGTPALSDASSDEQIARATSASRKSTRSSAASVSSRSSERRGRGGFQGMSEYEAAAAYGTPALSDASSDEQIAQAASDSMTRYPPVSRAYSYATSGSSTPRSQHTPHHTMSPTPTPRYAADEVIARNLARSLNAASIQSDLITDPGFVRPSSGPPLVVRSPSPTQSIRSVASSQRPLYQSPSGPLSPLLLPTRYLHTPSIRSMDSVSSLRSASSAYSSASSSRSSASSFRSASSISTIRSKSSISSLLSDVTRSSRHESLDSAARALRASLPPSLSRSASSVSSSKLSRASSRRSTTSTLSARGITPPEKQALEKLRALAMSPVRCIKPGCGTLIPPAPLDDIAFPIVLRADAPPPLLFAALHASCPTCAQQYCRGCSTPTGCPAGCAGGATWPSAFIPQQNPASSPPPPCPVPTHCPAVRALGALAALIQFDRAHIAMGPDPRAHGRTTDKPLIGPLHALVFFLSSPPPPPFPIESLRPLSRPNDTPAPNPDPDPALPALVGLSRVPAYAASLLRAARGELDLGTWMGRAPAYSAVLRVLRALGDAGAGCRNVLVRPVRAGKGAEAWFRGQSLQVDVWREDGGEETLRGLIRRLEAQRVALLRLAGATTFKPTVEKAHALCDGILYLLLQDVLGEDEDG